MSLFDGDFPPIIIIAGVIYIALALALVVVVFCAKPKAASNLKPARSTGLKQSWEHILATACEEQLGYLHQAQTIVGLSEVQLQNESTYVGQLMARLTKAKADGRLADTRKAQLEVGVVASCAAAVKEAAVHILQAANSATDEVSLLDLRPAGVQLERAVEALDKGELALVKQCARAASELATLARQFALKMQSTNTAYLAQAGLNSKDDRDSKDDKDGKGDQA